MDTATLLQLFSQVTQAQLMARDMFRERVAAGREIGLHELAYPVLQGYDSFAMDSDLTIVGSDQLFNEQMGRHFQQRLGAAPQVVITTTITPGTDGGPKQSKSLNNYIGLTDTPKDKFGKLMSLPDDLVKQYSLVYTDLDSRTVEELGEQADAGGRAARDAKLRLAQSVVTRYHGKEAAAAERVNFISIFSDRNQPDEIAELVVTQRRLTVLDLLRAARPEDSNSELRRLIRQVAAALDGEKATDPEQTVDLHDREGVVLRSGRRAWHRITRTAR